MNLENASYLQVIIAKNLLKIYYCKSHKLTITPTLLSNITPQISIFLSIKRAM
jgi:hypothetical protein